MRALPHHFLEEGHKHEAREHLKELKKMGFYESAIKHLKKREERGGELLSVNPERFEKGFNRGLAWVAAAILVVSVPVFLLGFSSITGSIVGGYEKAGMPRNWLVCVFTNKPVRRRSSP